MVHKREYYKSTGLIFILVAGFIGIFLIAFASATDISTCQNIFSPGVYNLTGNINNDTIGDSVGCLNINVSNVTINCRGYAITDNNSFLDGSYGIFLKGTDPNTLKNITIQNCNINSFYVGVEVEHTNNSIFNNLSSYTRTNSFDTPLVLMYSSNNLITNSSFYSSTLGGYFYLSNHNNLTNCEIYNNGNTGLFFDSGSDYNNVYNNLFNNTNNFYEGGVGNYLNTTKTSATNIIGGLYIGGNYWGAPDSTGYSDTCTDSNHDGICDIAYTDVDDNLPLSNKINFEPSLPTITSPVSGYYNGNISINYTAAVSPMGNAISFYNITLLNFDQSYNKTIKSNNSLNLSYLWDSTGMPEGNYYIKVTATDNASLSSYDISEFTIDTASPYIIINSPLNGTYSSLTQTINISSSQVGTIITNIDHSLVSWWRMDDFNSTGDVVDYFGKNNGTNHDATKISNGKFGKAMSFNGISSYTDFTGNYSLNNITISLWVNPGSEQVQYADIIDNNHASNINWAIEQDGLSDPNRFQWFDIKFNLTANTWQHLIVIYNNGNESVYLNGSLVGTNNLVTSLSNPSYPPAVRIGDMNPGPYSDRYFNGSVDDLMIFNKSLSSTEILALYNATAPTYTYNFSTNGSHSVQFFGEDSLGKSVSNTSIFTITSDINYPQFSNNQVSIPSGLVYNSTGVYQFNITLTNTNGTAKINFNGTNYTLSNTSSVFNWTYVGLPIGTYTYYFWAYGNGSSHLFNSTLPQSWNYIVAPASDSTPPIVSIVYPVNANNYTNVLQLNYTCSDNVLCSKCWYSNDSGGTNSTPVSTGTNFTNMTYNEGINNWTVYCNDTSGNVNSSKVSFFIDSLGPVITFTSPSDGYTYYSLTNNPVNFTRSDTGVGISKCWWSNSSGLYNHTLTNSLSDNITFSESSDVDNHNITIWCNDTLGNVGSNVLNFSIDSTGVSINLASPQNNFGFSQGKNMNFNFTVHSGVAISGCQLWGNWTGSWQKNQTITSVVGDGLTYNNFSKINLSDGAYLWNIWCNDSNNNYAWSTVNNTFYVDTTPPAINIIFPVNQVYTASITELNYTASDLNPGVCWYSNNSGTWNSSVQTYSANWSNQVSTEGSNTWIVYCNDTLGNLNSSSVTFTINTTQVTPPSNPGGGGGGGGATPTLYWTKTIALTDSEFTDGNTGDLGVKERFSFNSSGDANYVGVMGFTANSAIINTSFTQQQVMLSVGQEKKFDIDSDGYYDVYIKLDSITNNKASITLHSIYEKINPSTEENLSTNNNSAKKENSSTESPQQSGSSAKTSKLKIIIFAAVIAVIAVIVIIFFSIYFIRRSKKLIPQKWD